MSGWVIRGFIEGKPNLTERKLGQKLNSIEFKGMISRTSEDIGIFSILCNDCKIESIESEMIDSYCPVCKEKVKEESHENN